MRAGAAQPDEFGGDGVERVERGDVGEEPVERRPQIGVLGQRRGLGLGRGDLRLAEQLSQRGAEAEVEVADVQHLEERVGAGGQRSEDRVTLAVVERRDVDEKLLDSFAAGAFGLVGGRVAARRAAEHDRYSVLDERKHRGVNGCGGFAAEHVPVLEGGRCQVTC